METYTIGAGRTYTTLAALLAAVTLQPGDIVDGGGETYTDQWTLQLSSTTTPIIYQNASVDVSANAVNAYGVLADGNGSAHVKGISGKGSGGNGVFRAQNSGGSALVGSYPVIFENITVVSNFGASDAGNNHDGVSTDGNTQVELRGTISISGCRASPEAGGSHQCITAHSTSKIKSEPGCTVTLRDSTMGCVAVSSAQISLAHADMDQTVLTGLDVGSDGTADCLCEVLGGSLKGGKIAICSSTTSKLATTRVKNASVDFNTAALSYARGAVEFIDCDTAFSIVGVKLYGFNSGGSYTFDGGTITVTANTSQILRDDSGYINLKRVTLNLPVGYGGPFMHFNGLYAGDVFGNVVNLEGKFLQVISGKQAPKVHHNTFKRSTSGGVIYDIDQNGAEAECLRLQHGNNVYVNIADTMQLAAGAVTVSTGPDCCYNSESTGASTVYTDDPQIDTGGKFAETSPILHLGAVVAGVNDAGELDIWGNAVPAMPNIGADQGAGKGFGPWSPFDSTLPDLSLSPTAPGDLRSVQAWSKVATAQEIENMR